MHGRGPQGDYADPHAGVIPILAVEVQSKKRVAWLRCGADTLAQDPMYPPLPNPAPFMVVAAIGLAALQAHADGGTIGNVYAVDGQVFIQRGCESWAVRESAQLRLSDVVRTAPGSRARIRIAGFGHVDLEPEASIQAELFYRSPNETALKSLLELSIQSGGMQFVTAGPDASEARLGFRDLVLSMQDASVVVEKQQAMAGVTLLAGEISIETRSGIDRRQAPAFVGAFDYRSPRIACTETS